jgi:membrane-associated protein
MDTLLHILQSIPDSPQGILRFVMGLLLAHGYLVIFIGAALDNFGLPASGDVVLFAGGWFANVGRANLLPVMLSGLAGALVSDNAVYWIGRKGGRPLINRVLKMRFLHFAGVTRMKYYRFLPYNLAAAIVWSVAYTLVGYVFGSYWSDLLAIAKSFGLSVVALVILILLAYVLRRRRARIKRSENA